MSKELKKAEAKAAVGVILPPAIIQKPLSNGQYLPQSYPKKAIFLHHTSGGTMQSAWDWWNQTPERVGTAFIIERDGKIYQCFDPQVYAFHLGIIGDDNSLERESIGIEIVSWGGLKKKGDKYYAWPQNFGKEVPKDQVYEHGKDYRGYTCFHKYTDEQVKATKDLVNYLLTQYPGIKLQENLQNFWEYQEDVIKQSKAGLYSHTTVRKDKHDIFPQPNLVSSLVSLLKV